MSYPRGIDEYAEHELVNELRDRRERRLKGLCDYCGRTPDAKPCRRIGYQS